MKSIWHIVIIITYVVGSTFLQFSDNSSSKPTNPFRPIRFPPSWEARLMLRCLRAEAGLGLGLGP